MQLRILIKKTNKHQFNYSKLKILDYEHNWNKRLTSEMLFIQSNKNCLNIKDDFRVLHNVYSPITKCIST